MQGGMAQKEKSPCFYIPFERDEQLYYREEIFAGIGQALDPIDREEQYRLLQWMAKVALGRRRLRFNTSKAPGNILSSRFWSLSWSRP